jgi:flagellar protein FliS
MHMDAQAHESYLVTEVMTAPPPKLRLLLLEAAIRAAEQARQKWRQQRYDESCELLIRAQDIVAELMAGLNREAHPQLVDRMSAVYLFVLRALMEANRQRSEQKLDEALRVLRIERETWRELCKRLGNMPSAGGGEPAGEGFSGGQPDGGPAGSRGDRPDGVRESVAGGHVLFDPASEPLSAGPDTPHYLGSRLSLEA